MFYQDECTFYRQPSQAWLWSWMGRAQPHLHYSHRSNTRMRVVGYLNATTGAVHTQDMSTVTVDRLAKSVRELSELCPEAERIYLAWDNWPNHNHPKVQAALASQPRVRVLPLPTYSPWLNPIEKVWRRTRQRVTHAHPWSDDFREYREQVRAEFQNLAQGSEEVLRYTGLFA
jgi:putative transposase